jgi:hypothetical protein
MRKSWRRFFTTCGSTVRMGGGKMNKIESGSVTVGTNEEEAYFEKRSSTVQRMDSTDRTRTAQATSSRMTSTGLLGSTRR